LQDTLKCREDVLLQIVEGLSTAAQLMATSEQYAETADRQLLDEALRSLLRLEMEIQFMLQEEPSAVQPADMEAAAADGVNNYVTYLHHVFEPGQACKVGCCSCLGPADVCCSGWHAWVSKVHTWVDHSTAEHCLAWDHHAAKLPFYADSGFEFWLCAPMPQVLAMTDDDIVTKLGYLAGQCALQAVKHRAQLGDWRQPQQHEHHLDKCHSSSSASLKQAAASGISNSSQLQVGSSGGGEQPTASIPAAAADGLAGTPAFEYVCLAGTLFWWDMSRFVKVAFTNFEMRQPLIPPPLEFWRLVAHQLQLTPGQIATFKGFRGVLRAAMGSMFDKLQQSVQEQQAVIQQEVAAQQQQELRQMLQQAQAEQQQMMQQMHARQVADQAFLQQQTPAEQQRVLQQMQVCQQLLLQCHTQQQQQVLAGASHRGTVLAAHEAIVNRQAQVLSTWHIIWMHMVRGSSSSSSR
jgi:hypothetical protein